MKRIVWIFLGCLFLPTTQAASFDCSKAASKVEKLICANAELSTLDEELTSAYKTALKDGQRVDAIKQTQKQWVKERNDCADVSCMKAKYEARLSSLRETYASPGDAEQQVAPSLAPVAKTDSELDVPELRYACKQNHTIDVYLSQYADASGVNEISSAQPVPYQQTFRVQNGYPEQGKPLYLKCAMWSGTYTLRIGATWSPEKIVTGVFPTVTVERDGKVVLPTTVLGECETKNPNYEGDCNKDWGIRISIFESFDRMVDGKPVGIYAGVNVQRITKDSVSYGRVR